MNKKGIIFKNVFFGILVFGMIIIGMGLFISEWSGYYSSNVNPDIAEFNKGQELTETAGLYVNRTTIGDAGSGQDAEVSTFRGAYGILGTLNGAFEIITGPSGVISVAKDRFGIPNYIIVTVITMMLFAIIFGIISVVFRLARRGSA